MTGGPHHLIQRADGTVQITEQSERKLLSDGERMVGLDGVERCAQNDAVE